MGTPGGAWGLACLVRACLEQACLVRASLDHPSLDHPCLKHARLKHARLKHAWVVAPYATRFSAVSARRMRKQPPPAGIGM